MNITQSYIMEETPQEATVENVSQHDLQTHLKLTTLLIQALATIHQYAQLQNCSEILEITTLTQKAVDAVCEEWKANKTL